MSARRRRMNRLFSLARAASRSAASTPAPEMRPGFATRVAARWAAGEAGLRLADLWERLCWRGVAVAGAICLGAVVYSAQVPEPTAFDLIWTHP